MASGLLTGPAPLLCPDVLAPLSLPDPQALHEGRALCPGSIMLFLVR